MDTDSNIGLNLNDRYNIVELIGRGGMGSVYLGKHLMIGRRVAVKILREEFARNQEMIVRFYREAQAAAAIGHRNIIDVFDVGVTPSGNPFLVMEYLEGESLYDLLKRKQRISLSAACGIMEPVLLALDAAHKKDIVHRDLKTANIFLVRIIGEKPLVKLIDFGVSKMVPKDEQARLTRTGAILGTPHYMSPEQAQGSSNTDSRTDVYAAGVILYEMLTGVLPFEEDNYLKLIQRIVFGEYTPPEQVYPDFPTKVDPIIKRVLAKNVDDRYQSVKDLLEALQGLDCFKDRFEGLARIDMSDSNLSVATGDLGLDQGSSSSESFANDYLSRMVREQTPVGSADADTSVMTSGWLRGELATVAKVARYRGWVLVIFVAAVVIVLAAFFLFRGEPGDKVATMQPEKQALDTGAPLANISKPVMVTVVGSPKNAKIFYRGSQVPVNPFPVEKGSALVPLRVEASGFEPFRTSLIPDKDQSVQVKMIPVEKAQKEPEPKPEKSDAKPRKKGDKPKKSGDTPDRRGMLKKGRRGAEFIEQFK